MYPHSLTLRLINFRSRCRLMVPQSTMGIGHSHIRPAGEGVRPGPPAGRGGNEDCRRRRVPNPTCRDGSDREESREDVVPASSHRCAYIASKRQTFSNPNKYTNNIRLFCKKGDCLTIRLDILNEKFKKLQISEIFAILLRLNTILLKRRCRSM